MASDAIPEDVRRFLVEQVRSLMALELLLLLRADPQRPWTMPELVRELRSGEEWTERELARLAARDLVAAGAACPVQFRCSPAAAASGPLAWLAKSYPERRFSITQVMYPPPADPVQRFADAFRLRKDPPHG